MFYRVFCEAHFQRKKNDVFGPRRIDAETPLFLAISFLQKLTPETLPPLGAGGWWLVVGGWWLVAGGWLAVAGGWLPAWPQPVQPGSATMRIYSCSNTGIRLSQLAGTAATSS